MIPVSALLQNVSYEVERLAQVAEGLDEIVGDLAASNRDGAAPLSVRFQDVDALRQALHAIAQVTMTAARDIPQGSDPWLPKGALAEGVTLEKVRDACLCTDAPGAVPARTSTGEMKDEPSFFDEF